MDSRIIDWDGQHFPEELHQLPPGRYRVEPLIEPLTADEDAGIVAALRDLDEGKRIPMAEVMSGIERALSRL